MGEVIKFPEKKENKEKETEKKDLEARYDVLMEELDKVEAKLYKMYETMGDRYNGDLRGSAKNLIAEMQFELAEMRERKFFSPVRRRELLNKLKEVRKISKEGGKLLDEYGAKWAEAYWIGLELGPLETKNKDNLK